MDQPTIEDETAYAIDGTMVTLLDTAGIDSYRLQWPDQIKRCSAILVIFNSFSSLAFAQTILKIERNCPAILVSNNRQKDPLLDQAGRKVAEDHGIDLFQLLENSPIKHLFTMAVEIGTTLQSIPGDIGEVTPGPTTGDQLPRDGPKHHRLKRWISSQVGRLVRRLKFWTHE